MDGPPLLARDPFLRLPAPCSLCAPLPPPPYSQDHQRIHDFAALFGLEETGGSDNHGTLKVSAPLVAFLCLLTCRFSCYGQFLARQSNTYELDIRIYALTYTYTHTQTHTDTHTHTHTHNK